VLSQLGFALYQLKRINEAAAVLAAAVSLAPADPDVLYLSGLVAALRGDSEAAVELPPEVVLNAVSALVRPDASRDVVERLHSELREVLACS